MTIGQNGNPLAVQINHTQSRGDARSEKHNLRHMKIRQLFDNSLHDGETKGSYQHESNTFREKGALFLKFQISVLMMNYEQRILSDD